MSFISKYNKISQLKKNVILGSTLSGVDVLVTMISYPIYLKYLSAEKYGLWTIIAVVLSFSQLGQLKIAPATTKFVAGFYWKKDFKSITEHVTTAFYILTVPSLVIICVLAFFNAQIAGFIGVREVFMSAGERLIFFVGFLSIFSFYVDVTRSVVVGIGRLDIANVTFCFCRIFQIILAVCLLVLGVGIWSLYFGYLAYYFVAGVVFFIILKYNYRINIFDPFAYKKQMMREIMSFSGMLTISTIANILVVPFNKIIISRYVGLSEVAYYHIAYRLIDSIRGLFLKGLEAILPKFSELHSRAMGAVTPLLSLHRKGMLFLACSVLPLFLLIFIFANPIIKIWIGKDFHTQIAVILKILLVGWFCNIMSVPDMYMFLGIGKVRYNVTAQSIKAITNVIIIFAFIFLNIQLTLVKVATIDSICLVFAVIFLKYKYFEFRKLKLIC